MEIFFFFWGEDSRKRGGRRDRQRRIKNGWRGGNRPTIIDLSRVKAHKSDRFVANKICFHGIFQSVSVANLLPLCKFTDGRAEDRAAGEKGGKEERAKIRGGKPEWDSSVAD